MLEGGRDAGRDAYGAVVRVKTSAGTLTKVKSGGSAEKLFSTSDNSFATIASEAIRTTGRLTSLVR